MALAACVLYFFMLFTIVPKYLILHIVKILDLYKMLNVLLQLNTETACDLQFQFQHSRKFYMGCRSAYQRTYIHISAWWQLLMLNSKCFGAMLIKFTGYQSDFQADSTAFVLIV